MKVPALLKEDLLFAERPGIIFYLTRESAERKTEEKATMNDTTKIVIVRGHEIHECVWTVMNKKEDLRI